MPSSPVTRGDVADLAVRVGALQRTVHELAESMGDALAVRPTETDIKKQRKQFIRWSLVILLIAQGLTVITLSTVVSRCFLVMPKGTLYSVCSVIPGYDHAQQEQKKDFAKFNTLLSQIPKNEQRSQQQQREINHLKAVLRRHGIKT